MIASKQVASDWGSPEHPEHDDRARRPIWQQLHEELYYSLDCTFVANEAFSVRSKVVRFGPALVDSLRAQSPGLCVVSAISRLTVTTISFFPELRHTADDP